MNLIYSTSEQSFHIKPADAEYKNLKFTCCKTKVEELIERIVQGMPFTCQVYISNKRDTNDFIAQTSFALDFDETLTLDEANEICRDYGINYLFGYYTYSHTEHNPRFRLVFAVDGEVRDARLALDIYKAFSIIFNFKNDQSCLDLARTWAGTNNKSFRGEDYHTFNITKVFELANEIKYSLAGGRKRKLFEVNNIEKTGDDGNTIQYRYRITHIPPICVETETSRHLIDNWKLEDLFRCSLFKTFYEGKGTPELGLKLTDGELLCMAANLMTLLGGEKLYKDCLKKNANYSPVKKQKISWLRNNGNYKALLIGEYSPYEDDKINPHQTFPEMLRKKGKVEFDIATTPLIYNLAEGETKMIEEFEKAVADTSNTVYLFKLAAGLGKSQYWKNKKGIAIGFPNNNLKNEQFNSSDLSNDEKLVTPEALSKFTKPVQSYLNSLYKKGLNEAAFFKIKDLANGKAIFEDGRIEYNDMNFAVEYLKQNKKINDADADKTVFTTHTRLLHQEFKHETYVFDENAFGTIFEHHKATLAELMAINVHLKFRGCITDELDNILSIKDDGFHNTPDFNSYIDVVKEIIRADSFKTNVLKFFQSSRFMFDGEFIHYEVSHLNKLPTDKKLIFLDATASIALFKKVFGARLKIIDISNVKLQGTIEQDTSKSCSKKGLDIYHDKISAKVDDKQVITHNDYKKYFKNPIETLHFGNLTGSNILSGKNFCVVGTMTYHPTYYKFLAAMLNINCDDFKMKNLKVTYEGRRFWFTTFENPELQRLHLEQVEGELIQGVQRGRLLRTDAIVWLYSNFPLLQANYVQ